jgi:hypothetical protein
VEGHDGRVGFSWGGSAGDLEAFVCESNEAARFLAAGFYEHVWDDDQRVQGSEDWRAGGTTNRNLMTPGQ